MDNFSAEQYDRYEAYRRNALPKQAVRRVRGIHVQSNIELMVLCVRLFNKSLDIKCQPLLLKWSLVLVKCLLEK